MNGITWTSIYEIFPLFPPSSKHPQIYFRVSDNKGVILLNRLRVGFSHLREHKFRHNLADTVDPFCNCRTNSVETTLHFLMHCSDDYSNDRNVMFNRLLWLDITLFPFNPEILCRILFYGDPNFSAAQNHGILTIAIKFIRDSGCFGVPLY